MNHAVHYSWVRRLGLVLVPTRFFCKHLSSLLELYGPAYLAILLKPSSHGGRINRQKEAPCLWGTLAARQPACDHLAEGFLGSVSEPRLDHKLFILDCSTSTVIWVFHCFIVL